MSLPPPETATPDLYDHLKACSRKKMSIAAYAKANNIPVHRLYDARKRQKLNKRAARAEPSEMIQSIPEFVELTVTPALP